MRFDNLKDRKLLALDGEIGAVKDLYFEDLSWHVRYLVVNTGNWLTGRKVLLSPTCVSAVSNRNTEDVIVDLTREQIENSPDISEHMPVSRQHEADLAEYYQWPTYWVTPGLGIAGGTMPLPVPSESTQNEVQERIENDPEAQHLRSLNEVNGYHVRAKGADVGRVEDAVLDVDRWRIRFFLVSEHQILSGEHYLLSSGDISLVDWSASEIVTELEAGAVPKFDPEAEDHPQGIN